MKFNAFILVYSLLQIFICTVEDGERNSASSSSPLSSSSAAAAIYRGMKRFSFSISSPLRIPSSRSSSRDALGGGSPLSPSLSLSKYIGSSRRLVDDNYNDNSKDSTSIRSSPPIYFPLNDNVEDDDNDECSTFNVVLASIRVVGGLSLADRKIPLGKDLIEEVENRNLNRFAAAPPAAVRFNIMFIFICKVSIFIYT